MGILCVFCVYDTIGNRCFEKTAFPKTDNVSATTPKICKFLAINGVRGLYGTVGCKIRIKRQKITFILNTLNLYLKEILLLDTTL